MSIVARSTVRTRSAGSAGPRGRGPQRLRRARDLRSLLPLVLAGAVGCAGSLPIDAGPRLEYQAWGNLREVLRERRTEGRVDLAEAAGSAAVGLGLLEGLGAEITIDGGVSYLAAVENGRAVSRTPRSGDRATLLAVARVGSWSSDELPAIESVEELEDAVRTRARAAGLDPAATPIPLRVRGRFAELRLHVLDRSCPMANPEGPPPARHRVAHCDAVLVGFYAEGQAGKLTHRGQRFHLHAIVEEPGGNVLSGHVDALRIEAGARLELPGEAGGTRPSSARAAPDSRGARLALSRAAR